MILGIAIVVVLILLAVALLPARKPGAELKQALAPASIFQPEPVRPTTLREQQVQEEASAIAAEFHRRADEVWLAELRSKAAELLAPPTGKA